VLRLLPPTRPLVPSSSVLPLLSLMAAVLPVPRMVHRPPIVSGFCWCVVSSKWLRGFAAATGAECDHLVMGRCEVAQAQELVRALRHQLHETTTQLAWVERQDVTGRNGRTCAMYTEACALRRDYKFQVLTGLRAQFMPTRHAGPVSPRRNAR
jgi:hypothetical protein